MNAQVITGSGAPSDAPAEAGMLYVDVTNKVLYFSVNNSSAADWVKVN